MLTPQVLLEEMRQYGLTQAAICIASGVSEPELSNWLRGRGKFSPDEVHQIEIGLGALANLAHDSIPWPLNWRSPDMVPLIKKYIAQHELYLREKAQHDAREAAGSES